MLRNLPLFLPLPTPSSPPSRTPPAPFSLGLPPCPPPHCAAGENTHTRARAKFREDATRGERQKFLALPSRRVSSKFRARACISPARQAIAKIRDYSQSIQKQKQKISIPTEERLAFNMLKFEACLFNIGVELPILGFHRHAIKY